METMDVDAYRALLQRQEEEERGARKKGCRKQHAESDLQQQCVEWFRSQYSQHSLMLFAVPNGGVRSKVEAGIMKAEGVTAGVSDLILLEARGGYGALCIEMKTEKKDSRQRQKQKEWQHAAELAGNRYELVRSLDEFMAVVNDYMKEPMIVGRCIVKGKDLTAVLQSVEHRV